MTENLVATSHPCGSPFRMVNKLKFANLNKINLKVQNGMKNARKLETRQVGKAMSPISRARIDPRITNVDLNPEVTVSHQVSTMPIVNRMDIEMVKINVKIAPTNSKLVKIENRGFKRMTKSKIWRTRFRILYQSGTSS